MPGQVTPVATVTMTTVTVTTDTNLKASHSLRPESHQILQTKSGTKFLFEYPCPREIANKKRTIIVDFSHVFKINLKISQQFPLLLEENT